MNDPLVSITVNCFNGEKYLREALDSIYRQTYKNWEIVFFDNKSSDRSAEIAKSYDSRTKYYSSEVTLPLGEARKLAVERAKGEWIAFLDADDIWDPEKLELQLECIKSVGDIFLLYGGISEINESGEVISSSTRGSSGEVSFSDLLNNFDINMVTPLINKTKLFELGLNFDPEIEASEEYNLFMRIAAQGRVYYLNERLGYYRVYDGSLTDAKIHRWAWERLRTVASLLDYNPNLFLSDYEAVSEAIDRGIYYHACYLQAFSRYRESRMVMSKIKYKSWLYFILFLCAYFPALWRGLHSKAWKNKLTKLIKRVR